METTEESDAQKGAIKYPLLPSLSLSLTLTSYIQISGGDKILSSNFADRQTDPSRRPDRRKRALGKLDVNRH